MRQALHCPQGQVSLAPGRPVQITFDYRCGDGGGAARKNHADDESEKNGGEPYDVA